MGKGTNRTSFLRVSQQIRWKDIGSSFLQDYGCIFICSIIERMIFKIVENIYAKYYDFLHPISVMSIKLPFIPDFLLTMHMFYLVCNSIEQRITHVILQNSYSFHYRLHKDYYKHNKRCKSCSILRFILRWLTRLHCIMNYLMMNSIS